MPIFLEEDGTGITDATSYVSVAYSEDYLGSTWAVDEATKQTHLMAASEYADIRWGHLLKSRPLLSTQGLEMPRKALYDRYGTLLEGVPDDWKKAICLYAKESLAATLYPSDPTTAKDVKRKKTVVGPITTEVEFQGIATAATFLPFPLADKFAKMYIYGGGTGGVMRN